MRTAIGAVSMFLAAGIAAAELAVAVACTHPRPVGASTWPPPCAGSRILEVTNPTAQTWEVTWGDERLGTAGPGLSRLPVASIRILDARLVGSPEFRIQSTRTSVPGPTVEGVRYRLLCE